MDPDSGIDRGRAWATGSEPYDTSLRRYIRQAPPGSADYGFCQACNSVDFAAIRAIDQATILTTYTENIGRVYHVFRLPHLRGLENPSCPLCRMLCMYRGLRNKLRNVDQDQDTWTSISSPSSMALIMASVNSPVKVSATCIGSLIPVLSMTT